MPSTQSPTYLIYPQQFYVYDRALDPLMLLYSHSFVGLVLVRPLPVLLALLPLALVDVAVRVRVLALPVLQVVSVITVVFRTSRLNSL